MKEIGRNDPCPCGSGKKFKRCCLGKAEETNDQNPAQQFMNEVMTITGKGEFESLEELQAVLDGLTEKKNRVSNIDFLGFSSEQMHRMPY